MPRASPPYKWIAQTPTLGVLMVHHQHWAIRCLKPPAGTTGRRTSPVKERTREHDGFTTVDEGLDLVEQAYPGRPIPAKVKFLLTEIVDSMQH